MMHYLSMNGSYGWIVMIFMTIASNITGAEYPEPMGKSSPHNNSGHESYRESSGTNRLLTGENHFEWERKKDYLALLNNGDKVWQFHFKAGEDKPFIHPLSLMDGTVLTAIQPEDHIHHSGMWFSWKDIDGLNYWRPRSETGVADGRTRLTDVKVITRSDFSAEVHLNLEYYPASEQTFLKEKRKVYFSRPDSLDNYYIDWSSVFTVQDQTIMLERTPLQFEEGGRPHGGYGGFSIRLSQDLNNILFTGQKVDHISAHTLENKPHDSGWKDSRHALHGEYSRWLEVHASRTNEDNPSLMMMVMAHPQNMNAPEPWWINEDAAIPFYYVNPSPLFYRDLSMAPHVEFYLSYRVIVLNTPLPDELKKHLYQSFLEKFNR